MPARANTRWTLIAPLVVAAVLVWAALPAFAAAGLALDHPAWSAAVSAATGGLAWWLGRGARPVLPRRPDFHRSERIS